jgi:hypothetical protein
MAVVQRLHERAQILRKQKVPIVYLDTDVLTPEQIWNQKVLDVFLKIMSLGYGFNIIWFENMTTVDHSYFYSRLHDIWFHVLGLTNVDRERIIPGHNAGRYYLFRWVPGSIHPELKWWRKHNLNLINAFVTRGVDIETQRCGALYILTALAYTLPSVAETYPWLVT